MPYTRLQPQPLSTRSPNREIEQEKTTLTINHLFRPVLHIMHRTTTISPPYIGTHSHPTPTNPLPHTTRTVPHVVTLAKTYKHRYHL